ncbi:hypothetical protein [Microbacterium sp. A1-JK]|uniref:hypothetical protein n=1 Tax=Microbacterium sp. A1-JK TaxID=3177516 RepID=UPI00388B469C
MKKAFQGASFALVITLGLTACTATPTLEVTTAPPVAVESTPTPTPTLEPTPEAVRGTRANPLAVAESRKISEASMWTVGASSATEVNDGYVVLPVSIGIDWAAYEQQVIESGETVENPSADPWVSLRFEFVTAAGRSFTTMDNYSVNIEDELYKIGAVYPPADAVSGRVAISVPADQVAGGTWVVQNSAGEQLFMAVD